MNTVTKPLILLTNDDGGHSPLFAPLIELAKRFGDVFIAVPEHEQSWKGKSMTRFGKIAVKPISIAGAAGFTIDGTPADAVHLAIKHLTPRQPTLVFSGINVGDNAGLAYMASSGTVGACLEGNLLQIPAIAFSQRLLPEHWEALRETRGTDAPTPTGISSTLQSLVARSLAALEPHLDNLTTTLLERFRISGQALTWNINFPSRLKVHPRVEIVPVTLSSATIPYPKDDTTSETVLHQFGVPSLAWHHQDRPGDMIELERGNISVTPLNLAAMGQILDEDSRQLARAAVLKA